MTKFITLLCLCCYLQGQSQFNEIVSRIQQEPIQKVTVIPFVGCGMARNAVLVPTPIPREPVPKVYRPLTGMKEENQAKAPALDSPVIRVAQKPVKVIMRCAATPRNTEPLLVIDGVLMSSMIQLSMLKPEIVEDVTILKSPEATAIYGSRASEGVILIRTKSSRQRKLLVLDAAENVPVAGATLRFVATNKKDAVQCVANDSGMVVTDRLKPDQDYDLTISAIGFKTRQVPFHNPYIQQHKIGWVLVKNVISCPEVVIVNYVDWKRREIIGCGSYSRKSLANGEARTVADNPINIYPNPVQAGTILTIQHKLPAAGPVQLKLFTADGSLLYTQQLQARAGENRFAIRTSPHWPAGTCFFQLIYANNRVAASGQIILQ